MSTATRIEWTDASWNPTTGCDRISSGCDNCYALTLAKRLKAMGSTKYQTDGDPRTSGPGFGVRVHESALTEPLRWRKPRRVFVDSMSDLLHQDVSAEFIAKVFAVMALTRRHTFQILTKRHARMRLLFSNEDFQQAIAEHATDLIGSRAWEYWRLDLGGRRLAGDSGFGGGWTVTETEDGSLWSPPWPLPNVWLGVSVEDQHWADIRVPALLATPAAVRFLSCEPLLGPIDLLGDVEPPGPAIVRTGVSYRTDYGTGVEHDFDDQVGIDWVIAGGESGPHARPMHPDWARQLRDQCVAAEVPFFFKQWGEWAPSDKLALESDRAVHLLPNGDQYDPSRKAEFDTATQLHRVGKRAAGRDLEGRTWDEMPEVSSP